MDIEAEIKRLLTLAEPLRSLDEDDLVKTPLAGIVDAINKLRAIQAAPGYVEPKPKAAK